MHETASLLAARSPEWVYAKVQPFREGRSSHVSTSTKFLVFNGMSSSRDGSLTAYTGRYTQGDRWTLPREPYGYASGNPVRAFDPTGQVTITTGPINIHQVGINALYPACNVSMGSGLKGCMQDNFKYSCDCSCVAPLGVYKKSIKLVSPSYDIYAATNAYSNGKLVSIDVIIAEEMKHVAWFQQWTVSIKDSLEVLEDALFTSYKDCVKGCDNIYYWLKDQIKTGNQNVDATHP